MKNKGYLSVEKDITKSHKIKVYYNYLKCDLSYQFIQMNAKSSFLKKL